MTRKNQGSMLIMVMLILFVVLLFISAAVLSIKNLNDLQANENVSIKENVAILSSVNMFDSLSSIGMDKANLRGNLNLNVNGVITNGSVSFDTLNSSDAKFLIFQTKVANTQGKAEKSKTVFKPLPLLSYSHFIINPTEYLGNANVREECYDLIRSNNDTETFLNISGPAIRENGKPYIYMQKLDMNKYQLLASMGWYYDALGTEINLYWDDNMLLTQPTSQSYHMVGDTIIFIRNSGIPIHLIGFDFVSGHYKPINPVYNVTFVTDSPIFIESDIDNANYSILFLSDFIDTSTTTAFNFDVDKYIDHKMFPDNVNLDISNVFYGIADGVTEDSEINVVKLKSIFYAARGSFGFMQNNYNNLDYNSDVVNRYEITGGLIEYSSNYTMKKFENVPSSYAHLTCRRDSSYFDIMPNGVFPFVAPPTASNVFVFDSKYF